jgi:hypothetical protein
MNVGEALLAAADAAGKRNVAVVGIGKNVGKTVTVRAILSAAHARGQRVGLASVGRDGEAFDAGDALAKPRLSLHPGTVIATATGVLPRAPASEMLELSELATAAGPLVFVRVRRPAFYEIVGPPSASGIRFALERLATFDTDILVLDGAVDRVAALAGGDEAVIVATGAAAANTPEQAAQDARALVERLRIPRVDASAPQVAVEGALTPGAAADLIARGEKRQVVVRDPTQIVLSGKSFLGIAARLRLRCERPLHPVAVTVASIGREQYFEPVTFARAVAEATELPVYDVYAGTMVAA